jgi:hypothetical protein
LKTDERNFFKYLFEIKDFMHTFYIYSGQAGREVLKMIIKCYLSNSWDEKALVEYSRLFAVDQENVERANILPSDFYAKYWDPDGTKKINEKAKKKGSRIDKLLSTYILDVDDPAVGAGKRWTIGEFYAQKAFPFISSRFNGDIIVSDHFHISHSGGGGIGCGSGPVFGEGFREQQSKSKRRASLRAITSSIFLPKNQGEPAQAIPNTCSTIGNHSKWCDGIFIYDSLAAVNWEKYNGVVLPYKTSNQYWLVDYVAAEVQLMLSALNDRICKRAGKNFEGADLTSFTRGPFAGPCGLIVPCYAEYKTSLLKDLSLKVLIKDCLTRRPLVTYLDQKPIERVGLFIMYPTNFTLEEEKRLNAQAENWRTELMPNIKEDWTFFYSSFGLVDRVKIMALLVNPCIPRLFEMQNTCIETLTDWGNTLMMNGYTDVERSIKDLEDYCTSSFKDWKNPLGATIDYEKIFANALSYRIKKIQNKDKGEKIKKISKEEQKFLDELSQDYKKYGDAFKLYSDYLINLCEKMKF